jgi:hypothetical protein
MLLALILSQFNPIHVGDTFYITLNLNPGGLYGLGCFAVILLVGLTELWESDIQQQIVGKFDDENFMFEMDYSMKLFQLRCN